MSQRKVIEADPEIAAVLERRKAHAEGYEDGIWRREVKPAWPDDDPRALAYTIGYVRGVKARAEIVVQVKGKIAAPGPWEEIDEDKD